MVVFAKLNVLDVNVHWTEYRMENVNAERANVLKILKYKDVLFILVKVANASKERKKEIWRIFLHHANFRKCLMS